LSDSESHHPDLEVQSAFIEGLLAPDEAGVVICHLSRCARCRLVVGRAAEIEEEIEQDGTAQSRNRLPSRRRRSWKRLPARRMPRTVVAIAIAFIVLGGVWAAIRYTGRTRADPIVRMASAAPISMRTIQPRLSGGYRWAPFRNMMAGARDTSAEELAAGSVAGEVLQKLKDDDSARALHAKGVAYLIRDNAAAAVPLLRHAARLSPRDARVWNDLAAALYVYARSNVELREALAAARNAARLDPRMSEAHFNIALILERGIGTTQQIKEAWREYLRRDPSGGWSDEAKERLAQYQ
jgi:tetratricopeptide (TPR) repeat protein